VRGWKITIVGAALTVWIWQAAMADDDCPNVPAGDLTYDCRIDVQDFALMSSYWLVDCNQPINGKYRRNYYVLSANSGEAVAGGIRNENDANQEVSRIKGSSKSKI